MKKYLIFLLAVFICFLSACQGVPVENPKQGEGEQSPTVPTSEPEADGETNTVYQTISEKAAENDARYRWIKAFLDRDVKMCADLAGRPWDETFYNEREQSYEEWYAFLKDLEFGEYSVEEYTQTSSWGSERTVVRFSFEITKSEYDVFPIGQYVYDVTEGRASVANWERVYEAPVLTEDVSAFLRCLIHGTWSAEAISEVEKRNETDIFDAFFYFYRKNVSEQQDIPKEELEKGVQALFEIQGFQPGDVVAEFDGVSYRPKGHGGFTVAHKIESVIQNGTQTEVVVQFYADIMSMVKSHKVKYVFEEQSGDYPLRLVSVERLETGIYDPSVWMA